MAVWVAASDETSGGNKFSKYHYAGWLAPERDWYDFFAPAWKERVLDGPPKIPYLHMTEMRSRAWREKHGITALQVDDRLDLAADLIRQMYSLYPLNITIDGSVFAPLYKKFKVLSKSGHGAKDFQPDFLAFVSYAYAVLLGVSKKFPEAEKVDFLVENNSEITKHIHELYETLPESLTGVGHPELVPLMGEFNPAGKDRVPLQAADYLCWHLRRADAQTLDLRDTARWNTIASRKGFSWEMPKKVLIDLAKAFRKREKENAKADRVRKLRQNNARPNKSAARGIKSRIGARKGGKSQAEG